MIRQAIDEGIRSGFEDALIEQCPGRENPEERCPMRPSDGCACYWRAYHAAPFWRRWRMQRPAKRPEREAVKDALITQVVEDVMSTHLSQERT